MASAPPPSNFTHLRAHDEQLLRLGQLAELLAQLIASNVGLFTSPDEKQADLLRRLQDQGIVPREVGSLFHEVRRAGNDANHRLAGDHCTALLALRLTWQLGVWFHRTFKDTGFKSGPFRPPSSPATQSAELQAEEAKADLLQRLQSLQAQAEAAPQQTIAKFVAAANTAAASLQISERDTRKLIDEQLAAAGWTVNSEHLTFTKRPNARGSAARPEPGHCRMADGDRPSRLRTLRGPGAHRHRRGQAQAHRRLRRTATGQALQPRLQAFARSGTASHQLRRTS